MEIDYLIIGQGLAGSLLAWELLQRKKKVIIVDNEKENASQIAAGLINPVTGMRLVKSSDVDRLLPAATNYYKQLSCYFQQTFYFEKPMLRILRNNKEVVASQKRLQQPEYHNYLTEIIPTDTLLNAPFGLIKQNNTGYLLTKPLLASLKNHFIATHAYINAEIKYHEINFTPTLHWKGFRPKQIIFCEGYHASNNPWFSWLPFQLVKGEIITATASQQISNNILNYGHWFIPLNSHQFRTGATFDRENLNTNITLNAKQTLLNSLNQFYPGLSIDQTPVQHAGIRPTTLDKHPFIGRHPKHPELFIFNGFGAKGSLQIPWYCQCFADNLLNNLPIPHCSDILRYTHMISPSNR
ncbi:MAG: NAD(P)/FAD-dependent oxidoreductase [Methylococcaceae bacterium]